MEPELLEQVGEAVAALKCIGWACITGVLFYILKSIFLDD